ncbi:unnamed protein product [Parascedosporium putredinis]|uniref:Uncharacterized protein n=1 Tax=Parascedosporium putredinis TaxID=1442378 RepID=A0A9P1H022_9PEZI|nr:unnamed protein product [Parascedosporium putredinis]CAI7991367.1 unnamed protein product [Parascedosporium putredinis]
MPNTDRVIFTEEPPPALTPQRRLAKYVPGGLATEVQGWLSHIKGSEVEDEGSCRFELKRTSQHSSDGDPSWTGRVDRPRSAAAIAPQVKPGSLFMDMMNGYLLRYTMLKKQHAHFQSHIMAGLGKT